jgi:hypothetical protein
MLGRALRGRRGGPSANATLGPLRSCRQGPSTAAAWGYMGVDGEVLPLPLQEGLHEATSDTVVVFFPSGRLHRTG